MASVWMNSLSLPPNSQPPNPKQIIPDAYSNYNYNNPTGLKPIVVSGNPPTLVSAPGRRIVAVGDLHGDLSKARLALNMAGVLSSDGEDLWTGGETVLVQLGDILDRGEDEIAILSLLRSLDIQARAEGGAVFQVNGNHETMNVEGDFRYVDSGAFDECADFVDYIGDTHNWEEAFVNWVDISTRWREDRKLSQNSWGPWNLVKKQKGVFARSILLRPGGPLACQLAQHGVVLKVNDWIFCHGGLLPHHVAYGIERLNKDVSEWMKGLYEDDETLQAVGAKRMVVGHTPQIQGVNCEYGCSIWRVDVGMSKGVLDSPPEVLEIKDDTARPIRSRGDSHHEVQVVSYI